MVFHWSLSDSKSPQVPRTFLADFNNAVVWMVSIRRLISKSLSLCINPFVTVPSETWYAPERGKVRFNFCVGTNKPQRLTTKAVKIQVKQNYSHFMTCNRVDREENVGHWVARPDEIGMSKKEVKWLAEDFGAESSRGNLDKAF